MKAIKVEGLSKAYQLGDFGTGTISRDLERYWARLRGKEDPFLKIGEINDRTTGGKSNVVWSLKDINFEIEQGDAVGIIGRNGAGKSTLLKILSRITSPTTGSVKIRGRIASLLEVGTGFHPELTGRENIYLNGAILGMRKKEITRKFDEIVDFAGVERYVDTPVKRYSSGMYVRLAFAVAAHLESEILIVDEVLAVGDAEFQKKCLGKMGEVSKGEGRTVLFVSHQMGMINQLCNNAILLKNGVLENYGKTSMIVDEYINSDERTFFDPGEDRTVNSDHYFTRLEMIDGDLSARTDFGTDEGFGLRLKFASRKMLPQLELGLALFDKMNHRIFTIHRNIDEIKTVGENGDFEIVLNFPSNYLTPGSYSWTATLHIPHQIAFDLLENICPFQIIDVGTELSSYDGQDIGFIFPSYTVKK